MPLPFSSFFSALRQSCGSLCGRIERLGFWWRLLKWSFAAEGRDAALSAPPAGDVLYSVEAGARRVFDCFANKLIYDDKQLAQESGLSPTTINSALSRLAQLGIIEEVSGNS